MAESDSRRYSIRLLLTGAEHWIPYWVHEDMWHQVREEFSNGVAQPGYPDCFTSLDTSDGVTIAIRLGAIQAINFLDEKIVASEWPSPEEQDEIRIFLGGRDNPHRMKASACKNIHMFFAALMELPIAELPFANFTDENGEEIAYSLRQMNLVEVPTELLKVDEDEGELE